MNLIPGPVSKNPSLIQRKSVQDHSGLDDENLLFSPSCHFCFGERTISKKKKRRRRSDAHGRKLGSYNKRLGERFGAPRLASIPRIKPYTQLHSLFMHSTSPAKHSNYEMTPYSPTSEIINLFLNAPRRETVVEPLGSAPLHLGFEAPALRNGCQAGLRSSRRRNHIHLGYKIKILHCRHVFTCTHFFLVLHIEALASDSFAGRELGAFREMYYFPTNNTGTVKQTAGRRLNFK